jgi:hypothetical protein
VWPLQGCKNIYQERQEFINTNEEIAIAIISAIESYWQDNQEMPESLDALVPSFISDVPVTTSGDSFFYKKVNQDKYILAFKVVSEKGLSCTYLNQDKIWDCSFGSNHDWLP